MRKLTLIRTWHGSEWGDARQANGPVSFSWSVTAHPGWTLVRTVADVMARIVFNSPQFPPPPVGGLTAGLFQYVNLSGEQGSPSIGTMDADWLWYQHIPMQTGFGGTSATQSDLMYDGYLYIDSSAKRKALVDFPSLVFSIGPWPVWHVGLPVQEYTFSWQVSIRQLWEHQLQ